LGVRLEKGNYPTIRASEQSTPVFNFCLFINERQGIRRATINGHAESLVIRTLMKDAREILLR
jgi:two-component system sensor histidine kinase BarA